MSDTICAEEDMLDSRDPNTTIINLPYGLPLEIDPIALLQNMLENCAIEDHGADYDTSWLDNLHDMITEAQVRIQQ